MAGILLASCSIDPSESSGKNSEESKPISTPTAEQSLYDVFECDFSDSIGVAQHEREYEFADRAKYDSQQPQKSVNVTVNGITYQGTWSMTQYSGCNYYPVHTYNADGVSFAVDESGRLTSYWYGRSDLQNIKTKDECVAVARDFISDKIDLSQYEMTVETDEERKLYDITFRKFIDKIPTADAASVCIAYSGELYSYSSWMLGRVSTNMTVSETMIKDVRASVYEKMETIYENAKKHYSKIEYSEELLQITTLKDGRNAFVSIMEVDCIESHSEYDEVISERVESVIPLK